jgi:hypothetical protein
MCLPLIADAHDSTTLNEELVRTGRIGSGWKTSVTGTHLSIVDDRGHYL